MPSYPVETFQRENFAVTDLQEWPENVWMERRMKQLANYPFVPPAYSLDTHQILSDNPQKHVPVLMNLFYPPTQLLMQHCIDFGRVPHDALLAWPEDVRVVVIASGGLPYFVNDELFVQRVMKLLADYDLEGLSAIPNSYYQSSTSEIKSIPA